MSTRGKRSRRPEADAPPSQEQTSHTRRNLGLAAVAVLLLGALALVAPPARDLHGLFGSGPSTPKAAILDQLDLTFPNPDFVESATTMLERAGYEVDYFAGREVTVDLYRNLPDRGYDTVILRVHSGLVAEVDPTTGDETLRDYVSLFTGESYTETKYAAEVEAGPLGIASSYEGGPEYFGVGPTFIESSMNGDFGGAEIILMGCDGLRAERTAQAFLSRGASTFVSWDKPVSAAHTDEATELLLRHIYIDGMDIEDAVEQTMTEVGPDPTFDSSLLFYPVGDQS